MISLVRTATEMVHRLPETDTATLTTRDVLAWNVPGGGRSSRMDTLKSRSMAFLTGSGEELVEILPEPFLSLSLVRDM